MNISLAIAVYEIVASLRSAQQQSSPNRRVASPNRAAGSRQILWPASPGASIPSLQPGGERQDGDEKAVFIHVAGNRLALRRAPESLAAAMVEQREAQTVMQVLYRL